MLVLDVPFQPASEDIYNSKYNLKSKQGRFVDGNLYGTFGRVAEALAKYEKDHEYWSGEFMWALLNGAIPAGRILSNAGAEKYKPSTSLINCVVSNTLFDSIEGIGKGVYEAGISLSAGCGIGYEFSSLRPKGAYVNGVGAKTSGPLPFIDVYDKMCFTVASAGGRRGAQMATFDIRHPDVIEFIKAKREDGRFRQFNVSVLVTKKFLKAVETDGEWNLVFPVRDTELELVDECNLVWEPWHIRDPAYIMNEEGLVLCKIYGTIRARELWDLIASSAYDYAEPGVLFIDVVNEYNNLWFDENIRASNPCVSGDTQILTDMGYKPIQTLVGQKVRVWNGYEWSEVEPKITGTDRDTLKVSFSDGSLLCCTLNHKFVLSDGNRVEAKDLKIGDSLRKFGFPVIQGVDELSRREAYSFGFYAGDGSDGNRSEIWLYGDKMELAQYLDSDHFWYDESHGSRAHVRMSTRYQDKLYVPDASSTISTRLDWLAGLVDADGTRSSKEGGVSIWSVNRDFLVNVKRMLNTLGINAVVTAGSAAGVKAMADGTGGYKEYPVQECFRLLISPYNTRHLVNMGLFTHRVDLDCNPKRDASRFVAVTSIEEDGIEDLVYCFTEPLNHTGCFNGVVTGQCGEQPLPPYGACLLGSINLTHFVKKPFKDDAYFDMNTYIKVVRIFTRMLDNVVEMNGLPLEHQRKEILHKRRHGMGITGLGSAMAMMGIRYGSPTAIAMTDEVTKVMAVEGWKVGVELAKEKGPAPIMDEVLQITPEMVAHRPEMLEDGWEVGMPITGRVLLARYSRYMQHLKQAIDDEQFWRDLAEYGSRFSHHTSIAPTGTISLSVGNNISNGIEPSFAHHYQRNLTVEGKKTRQQTDVYSFELLAYRHLVNPNAMPGLENGSSLPDYFVTADDVHWREHLDMQCAAQKWVDSSISKTINVPTKTSLDDFKDVYTYAASRGAKGTAVFRYNPETLQGVLVRNEDLRSTKYKFSMADGTVLELFGNERVEYDGEVHAAANLYDAMKEQVYGRF